MSFYYFVECTKCDKQHDLAIGRSRGIIPDTDADSLVKFMVEHKDCDAIRVFDEADSQEIEIWG